MTEYGEFEVVGLREHRGHVLGDRFEARLDRAKDWAIARGDIRLLRVVVPEVQPGSYRLPDGWLSREGEE